MYFQNTSKIVIDKINAAVRILLTWTHIKKELLKRRKGWWVQGNTGLKLIAHKFQPMALAPKRLGRLDI